MQDQHKDQIPTLLNKADLRELSQINFMRSTSQILLEWVFVAMAVGVASFSGNIIITVLACLFIGTRQHALGVLLHDSVHYRLAKKKSINDFLGEWILAWPLLISLYAYRKQHFSHHKGVGSNEDPDFFRTQNIERYEFPKNKLSFLITSIKYLSGYYGLIELKGVMNDLIKPIPWTLQVRRISLYILVCFFAAKYNFWQEILIFWILPFNTVLPWILYLRLISEHSGLKGGERILDNTRHTIPNWWERILLAPNYVNFHIDHHLYPSVPFYRLPDLHKKLLEDPNYNKDAHITKGYLKGVLNELTNSKK